MPRGVRVVSIPTRPVLVYDGTCNLCRSWVHRWHTADGKNGDCLPAQAASVQERFPEISPQAFATAVHLINTDGSVYSGAEAIFGAMALGQDCRWPWRIYRRSPHIARIAEWAYRSVARHRRLLSWFMGRLSRTP